MFYLDETGNLCYKMPVCYFTNIKLDIKNISQTSCYINLCQTFFLLQFPMGQRMPTTSYAIPPQQPLQQQYQPSAPYQPSQQYPSQAYTTMFYQSQPMPVNQPQRPPSAPGPSTAPTNKRERKPIIIVDPNTGREVTEEILHLKSTPPGGSARSTPGTSAVPGSAGVCNFMLTPGTSGVQGYAISC